MSYEVWSAGDPPEHPEDRERFGDGAVMKDQRISESIEQAEAALKAKAGELSAGLRPEDFPPDMPAFYRSELAIRLLLANLVAAPAEVFERARAEHRASAHDGGDGDEHCEACGYIDAAVYGAKNPGRQLSRDFLEVERTAKEQP